MTERMDGDQIIKELEDEVSKYELWLQGIELPDEEQMTERKGEFVEGVEVIRGRVDALSSQVDLQITKIGERASHAGEEIPPVYNFSRTVIRIVAEREAEGKIRILTAFQQGLRAAIMSGEYDIVLPDRTVVTFPLKAEKTEVLFGPRSTEERASVAKEMRRIFRQ